MTVTGYRAKSLRWMAHRASVKGGTDVKNLKRIMVLDGMCRVSVDA